MSNNNNNDNDNNNTETTERVFASKVPLFLQTDPNFASPAAATFAQPPVSRKSQNSNEK